jgi:hypothetical protein
MRTQHGQPLNSLFGVGLDGNHFISVRFRDEKWQVQEPVEVNRHSAERFLWALFNLGQSGKPFSPEYLAGDFGSEGGNTVAIAGIHALYDAIVTTDNPKAQTFFSQWKILFGEVCGYDVDNPSDKIKKLAEFYQVGVKNRKPAEMLFAVHTYYALFMKLSASEIVAFFHKLPTPFQKMMQAGTSAKLKREMEDLEAGSIFRHLNITTLLTIRFDPHTATIHLLSQPPASPSAASPLGSVSFMHEGDHYEIRCVADGGVVRVCGFRDGKQVGSFDFPATPKARRGRRDIIEFV